jgi:NAD(P)H-flavin reductase
LKKGATIVTSIHRFAAKVETVRQLTHDVRQIDFALIEPQEITFMAGQFVSFDVPDARTGRTVTRPYSIASSPGSHRMISLLLNLVPHGPGSTYLFGLREGDQTSFVGPAGNFYLRDDLYYEDELAGLSLQVPASEHIITLSRPEIGWKGASGRVTTWIERQIQDVKRLAVYLCGNSGMITEVTSIIRSKGLCPIFREKYYDDASGGDD